MAGKNKVDKLISLRHKWLSQYEGTKNSIKSQLTALTWDVTAFEVFQEAVRLSPDASEGGKQLNGLVFNLLARAFYKSVMSDIRKLHDNSGGTVSLRRLLGDMRNNCVLLTRENLFASEGIEYDFQKLLNEENAYFDERLKLGHTFTSGPSYERSSDRSKSRHEQIDFMCSVNEQTRRPIDRLPKRLFDQLIKQLDDACSKIKDYVDNFIAHAAGESRLAVASIVDLTLNDLHNAHRELCKVGGFVSLYIFGGAQNSFFVHPSGDPLMYISNPILRSNDVLKVEEKFSKLENELFALSSWRPVI